MLEINYQNSKPPQMPLSQPLVDNDYFRDVWDVIECGIFILDVLDNGAEFRFAKFNPAFIRLMLSTDWLLGKTIGEAFAEEVAQLLRYKYAECVRLGETISFESQFQVNGCDIWWSLTVAPLQDKTSQIYQLVVTARDVSSRKATEATLQQSEQRFRQLFEGSADGIMLFDPESFTFTECNDAAAHMLGYTSASQLIGISPIDISPQIQPSGKTTLATAAEAIALTFERGSHRLEWVSHHVNGHDVYMELLLTLMSFNDKPVFQCIWRDISERQAALRDKRSLTPRAYRKRIEKALAESEARFRRLVENANDVIYEHSLEGIFTYVSPKIHELFGTTASKLVGQPINQYVHPEDAPKIGGFIMQMIETGEQQSGLEFRILHADANYRWVTCNTSPVKDAEGKLTAIQGILRDISDKRSLTPRAYRKAAEEAQKIAQARLEYLISESPGVIYCCEASEKSPLTFITQNTPAVLGYKPEEFLQNRRLWISKIHPEDAPGVLSTLHLLFERGQCTYEYRFLHEDGNYRWIHDRVKIIRDEDDNPLEILGYSLDITQRKIAEANLQQSKEQLQQKAQHLEQTLKELQRTQAQLVQSEKMSSLGQLVAGVAHEINNPVSFIYSNIDPAEEYIKDLFHLIQLYQQNYPQPIPAIANEIKAIDLDFLQADLPKLLSSMKIGAERIKEIVLSLRNFSRMDEAEYKVVKIHEGIDSTLTILEHRLKAQPKRPGISVIKEYGNLPEVECYAGQMNQVFMNILSNAIDALEERNIQRTIDEIQTHPSLIRINTEIENTSVVIRITDNGVGIPEQIKARLFDPFFTTKPVGKGTGMGLSISYQIITEKHGGTLECVSSPGGTEFIITIPLQQQAIP